MRIKKYTSLFLAILLLVSNFGLAFNVHFCGDKIASISSSYVEVQTVIVGDSTNKNCCCKKEIKGKNTCCKNKVVDLSKDSKDIIFKSFSFQIDVPFVITNITELHFAKAKKISATTNVTEYYCSPNAPPLFKLYQQYIFYA